MLPVVEAGVGVADRAEDIDARLHARTQLELGALADGSTDVGYVKLRRHGGIRQVQLQIVPGDSKYGGVGRHTAARPGRLHASLEIPGVLFAVRVAASR